MTHRHLIDTRSGAALPALARAGRAASDPVLTPIGPGRSRAAWAAWSEHSETMNVLAITYLNRLSDLLFILARHANKESGDVLWIPGGDRNSAG